MVNPHQVRRWNKKAMNKRVAEKADKNKKMFFRHHFFLVDQEFRNSCFEIQHFLKSPILNKCKFLLLIVYGELCKARNTWLPLPGHGTLIHIHTELYWTTFNCCELVGWGWALKTTTYSFWTLVDTGLYHPHCFEVSSLSTNNLSDSACSSDSSHLVMTKCLEKHDAAIYLSGIILPASQRWNCVKGYTGFWRRCYELLSKQVAKSL